MEAILLVDMDCQKLQCGQPPSHRFSVDQLQLVDISLHSDSLMKFLWQPDMGGACRIGSLGERFLGWDKRIIAALISSEIRIADKQHSGR